jgi:hypothetical protein
MRLIRIAAKYEEEVYGTTDIGFPSRSFSATDDRLGSGVVFSDGSTSGQGVGVREMEANAGRIEGWRRTKSYTLFARVRLRYCHDDKLTDLFSSLVV